VEVLSGDSGERGELCGEVRVAGKLTSGELCHRRPWSARADHRSLAAGLGEQREGELGHRRPWAVACARLARSVWVRNRGEKELGRQRCWASPGEGKGSFLFFKILIK
jgi:hypothetical protein